MRCLIMNQFLIAFVSLIHVSNGGNTKIWTPSTSLNVADNWEDNQVPCETDTLVFPSFNDDLVKIPEFSAKKIVFPFNGGFIFDGKMSLTFKEKSKKCKTSKTRIYKEIKEYFWLSTDNWRSASNNDNKAKPHEERLPCDNDIIIFPPNTSYEVDLQSTPYLSFKKLLMDDVEYNPMTFHEFLFTMIGQVTFKNNDNTLFIESECLHHKCPCHQENEALLDQLCKNEKSKCIEPQCMDPINPVGFCCTICGSMLQINLEKDSTFDYIEFRKKIVRAINSTNVININDVDYHMSIVMKNKHRYLQFIIVDKYEYNEASVTIMNFLASTVLKQINNNNQNIIHSGPPYSSTQSGHALAIIIGAFFLVSVGLTVIYFLYYDENNIGRLVAMARNRQLFENRSMIFARFDNSANRNREDSVVEVELQFEDQSVGASNSGFNNPMFQPKPETDNQNVEEVELKE